MEMKWMCHPNLPGQEIEVREESVSHYAHSGWLLMDGPPERDKEPEVARATVRGEPYDEGQPADAKSNEPPSGDADEASDEDDKQTGTTRRSSSRRTSKGDDK